MTLTKAQIAETVQDELMLTKNHSVDLVETLLEIIKQSLSSGENLLVSGFGKFYVHDKKARRGRNPATGEAMVLPPRRVVTFKCSGRLRERLNR